MKRIPITVRTFSIRGLASDEGADGKSHAFQRNPFATSDDSIAKIVGFCDEKEAGREYVFPLRLRTTHGEMGVLAGSSLSVDPE